jgi:hypothetical protein
MVRRVFGVALGSRNDRPNNLVAMKEKNLMSLIMLAVGKAGVRVFRNNTGQAWQGAERKFYEEGGRRVLKIYDPRPIDAGLVEGSSDLIGWTEVTITPEMVGQKIAVFTAIEVKKNIKSVVSAKQLNFLTVIRNAGGIAGLARDPEEAARLVKMKG